MCRVWRNTQEMIFLLDNIILFADCEVQKQAKKKRRMKINGRKALVGMKHYRDLW